MITVRHIRKAIEGLPDDLVASLCVSGMHDAMDAAYETSLLETPPSAKASIRDIHSTSSDYLIISVEVELEEDEDK